MVLYHSASFYMQTKHSYHPFGKEKGYPVLARCANLPVEIRNTHGIGGDTLVGWLPVVCAVHMYFYQLMG